MREQAGARVGLLLVVPGGRVAITPALLQQREWRASRKPMGARGRHIQNAYRKIGVSTRAAATLFALEHGRLASGEPPIAGRAVPS